MENKKVLLGLTTTPGSDWRGKIKEIDKFGIKEIALFPTCLRINARKLLYELLEKSGLEEIPHVHLRSQDMEKWELELFEKKYKTQLFNIHQDEIDDPILKPYLHKVYVENQFKYLQEDTVKKCAGICLDLSHIEEGRIWKKSSLDPVNELLDSYPVGCCHISAVKFSKLDIINKYMGVSRHMLHNLREVDYVAKYKQYLPQYISIELENSFEEQLGIKERLEKIIN